MRNVKIYFMYDNHTFARFGNWITKDDLYKRARKLFKEDGCGTLFARDMRDGDLRSLDLHGHQLSNSSWGVTELELRAWTDKVLEEDSFARLVA